MKEPANLLTSLDTTIELTDEELEGMRGRGHHGHHSRFHYDEGFEDRGNFGFRGQEDFGYRESFRSDSYRGCW